LRWCENLTIPLVSVFRTTENEPAPAPEPEPEPFTEDQTDDSGRAIDRLWQKLDQLDQDCDKCFERLERENIALKAKLDVVLTLLGADKAKSADVIDMPNWRRDVA
jgi:hypothetical protein